MAILLFILSFLLSDANMPVEALPIGASECEIIFNGIDLETKSHRIEINRHLLFNHTPPEIKNDLQEGNLMQAEAQIVQVDSKSALHLNIKIDSKIATDFYGSISTGNLLKVILLNGKEVELKCYAGSTGVQSQDHKSYIYPLGYTLEKKHLKQLSKMEIDKIGIQWSSGYEEYPIYEVDFFMNQISCLQRAQNSN